MKKKFIKIIIILTLAFLGIQVYFLYSPLFDIDYSRVILDENGEILRVFLNSQSQLIFPPNEKEIPYKLEKSIITFEDKKFNKHIGVDFNALGRAFLQNIKKKKRFSGASTITMQVIRLAKNRERTYFNKFLEINHALLLERFYSKKDILKFYINHAPYGGNVIGYNAASYKFFGKDPEFISWSEAATLAVLPNAPSSINFERKKEVLKRKRDYLLKKLYNEKIIEYETLMLSISEPLPKKIYKMPFIAPHYTRSIPKIKKNYVKTTIKKEFQLKIGNITKQYVKNYQNKGIKNGSVIVIDRKNGELKTYIGSNDYYDKNGGKIDGATANRSSGSILKPFLYALSIDEGIISKDSLIEDLPKNYGGYSPHNMSGKFKGLVNSKTALIESLNAPSVYLLNEIGIENFYNFLKKGSISTLFRTAKDYGLPLILGGAEVKLLEIAQLYYGLANFGEFRQIKQFKNQKLSKGKQLISKGSSYQVLEMLKDVELPVRNNKLKNVLRNKKIAFKTGTSYGNRDGWAVGVNNDYVVAVWVGSFKGESIRGLTGLKKAVPLMLEVFNYLPNQNYNELKISEGEFVKIEVSNKTGYRVSNRIKKLIKTKIINYPKNAKVLKESPYEEVVLTNYSEKEEICSLCWEGETHKEIIVYNYSPQLFQFYSNKGIHIKTKPKHKIHSYVSNSKNEMKIIHPNNKSKLFLPNEDNSKLKEIILKLNHKKPKNKVYWYINKKMLGITKDSHNLEVKLKSGNHKIRAIDEEGNLSESEFIVM